MLGASVGGYFVSPATIDGLIPPDRPRFLTPFTLTDRSGRPISQAALRGGFTVVSFVNTQCGLTCLHVTRQMAEIQRLAQSVADVRLVSITLDPRTDTVHHLNEFAASYGADPVRWLFLTGPKEAIDGLVESSFLMRVTPGTETQTNIDYQNTERLAILDPHGIVRGYFNGLKPNTPSAVIRLIESLRTREGSE